MHTRSLRSIAALVAVLVAMAVPAAALSETGQTGGNSTVGMARAVRSVPVVSEKVLYVTNRKPTGSKMLAEQFAAERVDTLSYGVARVAVPASSADDAAIDPETQGIKSLTFFELLGKLRKASRVLVVVHGFNTTFDQALAMAALLKRNLRTEPTILMISWPSMGSGFRYFADEEEALLSSRTMASILTDVAMATGMPKLQIVAHSLGTRLTTMALRMIFDSPQREVLRRLSQLVLAAPDIDRRWMDQEFIPLLEQFRIPTTVYGSEKDIWIGLSEFFHGHSRVGSFWNPSIYLRTLLTSVDVSDIDDGGHSVAFSPAVSYDLFFVLQQELPPESRPWLWKLELPTGTHWKMVPQQTK